MAQSVVMIPPVSEVQVWILWRMVFSSVKHCRALWSKGKNVIFDYFIKEKETFHNLQLN